MPWLSAASRAPRRAASTRAVRVQPFSGAAPTRRSRVRWPVSSASSTQVPAPRASASAATTRATAAVTGTGWPVPRTSPAACAAAPWPSRVSRWITTPTSRRTTLTGHRPPPPLRRASVIRSTLAIPWVRPASSSGVMPRTVADAASSAATSCSVGPVIVQTASAGFARSISSQVPVRSRTSAAIASSVSVRTSATAFFTIAVNFFGDITSHGPTGTVPSSTSSGNAASTASLHHPRLVVGQAGALVRDRGRPGQVQPARGQRVDDPRHRPAQPVRGGDPHPGPVQRQPGHPGHLTHRGVVQVGLGERGRPQHGLPQPGPEQVLVLAADLPPGHPHQPQVVRVVAHRSSVRVCRPRTRNATRPSVSMPNSRCQH